MKLIAKIHHECEWQVLEKSSALIWVIFFQKFLITALIFSIIFVMSSLSLPIDEQTSDENTTEVNVTEMEPGEDFAKEIYNFKWLIFN